MVFSFTSNAILRFLIIPTTVVIFAGNCLSGKDSSERLTISCINCTLVTQGCEETATELENDTKTVEPKRKVDRIFLLDSVIFENYLKHVDWSIIPDFRHDEDFENWTVPADLQKLLFIPYISGFDQHNQPIWVFEYGKNDYYKIALGSKRLQAQFHQHMRYLCYVALKSLALRNTEAMPVSKYVVIIDFEGIKPELLLHPKVLKLLLKMMSDSRRFAEKYISKIIGLNVNVVAEALLNLGRYFLLRTVNKFVVFGTNKAWWAPQLQKILPKESIPEKYGGNKGFKPLYYTT